MKCPDNYIDTIIQGDCLEVMKGIPDESIDLTLTSPPFKDEDIGLKRNDSTYRIARPENRKAYLDWLEDVLLELNRISKIVIIFNSSIRLIDICKRFNPYRVLIWNKKRTEQPYRYEPIFVWNNSDEKINKYIWNDCFSYLPVLKQVVPYENPVELYYNILKMFKNTKIILDPFLGSGTTALAAKKLRKHYIGIEISSRKIEIANKRIANFPSSLEKFGEIGVIQ